MYIYIYDIGIMVSALNYFFTQENVDILMERALLFQNMYGLHDTLRLYHRAIEICQSNGFYQKEAVIHCRLFEILVGHDINLAMKEAEKAISIDSECDQVCIFCCGNW